MARVPSGSEAYDSAFYDRNRVTARAAAEAFFPILQELLGPKSVADVGCGTGTWIAVFRENGITDVVGFDGSPVNRGLLEIPPENFVSTDLETRLHADRRFDLVLCLEVAENLPPDRADVLVEGLVGLGPAVLFSSAVPHQGGHHHVNEQW